MIKGMAHGGAVAHIERPNVSPFGLMISGCGRVIIPGDTDARLCKTCKRVFKIVEAEVPTTDAQALIHGCKSDHRHTDPAMISKKWTGSHLAMFRDVLADYEAGAENDACWIGTIMLILDKPNLTREVITPELSKRQGGHNPNAGLIDPNSKSKARKVGGFKGSEKQRDLILSLARQIDELDEEINGDESFSISAIMDDEFLNTLTTFDKVGAQIDRLFAKLNEFKTQARAKRAETRTAEVKADPAEDGFYVMGDTFVTVKWNRAKTGQYATVWSHDTEEWEHDRRESARILKLVKAGELARVTEADAIRFGELYGRCMRCSRELTDPTSILNAMGKTCRSKMGF